MRSRAASLRSCFVVLVGLAAIWAGCSASERSPLSGDFGLGGGTGATGGGGGSSGSGGSGPGANCPKGKGPDMIVVADPADSTRHFCIDESEVTVANYDSFAKDKTVDLSKQPGACSFNKTVVVDTSADGCTPPYLLPEDAKRPVGCIDWCDAWLYCSWAGKRLCGTVGGAGSDGSHFGDSSSQWYAACSLFGTSKYAYGDAYADGMCKFSGIPDPVMTNTQCVGGVPGLYDMSGNVGEWTDECATAAGQFRCMARGGAVGDDGAVDGACAPASPVFVDASRHARAVGIRCCADLL